MRSFGLVCVLFLLAGAATADMRGDAEAVPIGRLAAVSAALPPGAMGVAAMPVDSPMVEIIEPTPPVVTVPAPAVTRAEPVSRWEGRYSRRNRYWRDMPYHPGNWAPPEGPVRIALQAGHWKAAEAPDELRGIRDNGARAAGKLEWEVNLAIAREAAVMLEEMGYEVDVLPAVVPPSYRAHLFISIHADGSNDARATGYRVASPRRDVTGRADLIANLLEQSYGEVTGLPRLPTVTRRMSNYYAFNYRRYQHALHPLTVGIILETGFLTSASDRRVIVDDPSRAARGIVAAVAAFSVTPPPVRAVEATAEGAPPG
ncbi:MAG TPA: N-acetylmuramoyl-L-alanine amidase [Longimicrobiales bacterium]|nr:N-acetylmuramoyl-L-alanine amidase [Longimicrobiales bacterium]